jgi:hypothetical protein
MAGTWAMSDVALKIILRNVLRVAQQIAGKSLNWGFSV